MSLLVYLIEPTFGSQGVCFESLELGWAGEYRDDMHNIGLLRGVQHGRKKWYNMWRRSVHNINWYISKYR